jgi:hypothetical protein
MSMARRYSLSCRDLGIDDDFVSCGKTKSDVMTRMMRYVFRVHGIDSVELRMHMMNRMMR